MEKKYNIHLTVNEIIVVDQLRVKNIQNISFYVN